MKVKISLEEALEKARPGLRYKIEQSVALLRKAESLALMYDPVDGLYVGFSGGKDSQALYHVVELSGVKFKAHFSPTSVDPPQVIRFIRKKYPEVEFERITRSIFDLALEKRIFPTQKFRWCCAEFKEQGGAGKVVATGVRHAESVNRSKRKEIEVSGRKFAGTIDEFQEWRVEKIKKKMRGVNNDQFSRDKEQEVACISGKDKIIINPIIDWSDADVWDFVNNVVCVPHCELYDPPYNQHRIGCIMCPMSGPKQKQRDKEMYPYVYRAWVKVADDYIRGGYSPGWRQRSSNSTTKENLFMANGGGTRMFRC